MENATDALKIAFAVLVFVIALSVATNAFMEAKRTTDVLIDNALKNSIELKDEATKRFKELYEFNLHKNTKPYDGIYELLDELVKLDCNLAVLSNKPDFMTKEYVKTLLIQVRYFLLEIQKLICKQQKVQI